VALSGLRRVPAEGQRVGEAAVERLHHLGAQGQRAGGAVSAWLDRPPDDWRLAYIAFGLLVPGVILWPLLIPSFCAARAAVARARERDEPLGARRWLVYPPLVLVSLLLVVPLFLWPLLPAGEAASDLWRSKRDAFQSLLPLLPRDLVEGLVFTYVMAASLAVWWVALGAVLWALPRLAVALFRPFADGFGRRHAGYLVLTGLAIVALCLSLFVRLMGNDSVLVNEFHTQGWGYAVSLGPR
jgi:hypothetical protein